MGQSKIVYNPTGDSEVTLTIAFAASNVPGYARAAVRHDNVSTAGIRESILERIEDLVSLEFAHIPSSAKADWENFLDYALTGAPFDYYVNAAGADFVTYLLEDMEATLAYKYAGMYSLTMKVRKQIV